MQYREADWNHIGQYKICAYALREIVAGDLNLFRVRAAETDLFRCLDNRYVLRLDIDQPGTDGFTGDWVSSTDKPA